MKRLVEIGKPSKKYLVTIPETTGEILEYRVHISAIAETEPAVALVAMSAWLSSYVPTVPKDTEHIVLLCAAVCSAAELPSTVLADVRIALRRRVGVPDDYAAEGACTCPLCTGKMAEVPKGVCKFEGISAETRRIVGELGNLERLSMPYWAAQLMREQDRVSQDWRSYDDAKTEKNKGEVKFTNDYWERRQPGWRGGRPN